MQCANPACGVDLPAEATPRRRYCSGACRQAHHRYRHGNGRAVTRPGPDPVLLAERDEQLAAAAGELARLAEAATPAAGAGVSLPRSRGVAGVLAAADWVVRAAVERDRAAGLSWQEIGKWLELHPDTARARYGTAGRRRVEASTARDVSPTAASAPREVVPPVSPPEIAEPSPVGIAEHAPTPETVTPESEETPGCVTEKRAASEGWDLRRVHVGDDVDADTVRVEKTPDYEQTGRWRVLAGAPDDPVLVGFVARSSVHRTWQASTAWLTDVPGTSRTRQDAIIQLLLHLQDRRKRRR